MIDQRKGKAIKGLLLSSVLAILIYCAVNPVTGKKEFMLYTMGDEIQLGKQTDQQIIASYGLYEDPALTAYINDLGQRMGKITHRPDLQYSFKVLDTPVINAFAVPGGYIYFTRGILAHFNNEAELAGVLGHELGHVNARHSMKQYSQLTVAQLGLGLGAMFSEDFRKVAGIAEFGVGMLFLRFSRDNEREADNLGVEYSSKTGYDSRKMAEFFTTLGRLHPGSDMSGLPGWFSTHPNPVDRIGAINQKSAEWSQKLPQKPTKINRNTYLAKVDGIIFGEDPRQGYIEGNAFYHPALKFTFPIPEGWTLNNTPAQVQMFPQSQDASIILTMDQTSSPAQAAKNYVQSTNAIVQASIPARINGLQAQKVISRILTETDSLSVMSFFIKKESTVYAMHGFTAKNNYSKYNRIFSNTINRFKPLIDPKKMNITPKRIKMKTVKKSNSLRSVLKGYGIPEEKLESMAVLNGMQLNDTIKSNTKVKIVQ